MIIREVKQDLFQLPFNQYYFAHCVSSDYKLGAGIAKDFNELYDMSTKLRTKYPETRDNIGKALLVDNVFNLVTKVRYFEKPTYRTLYDALCSMKEQCLELGISEIAMPHIGCGLDRLQWDKVYDLILLIFEYTDISITVCCL